MAKYHEINKDLVKIIGNELGQNTADLFVSFYDGFSLQEQVTGAKEILAVVVGNDRTNELLKKINKENENY